MAVETKSVVGIEFKAEPAGTFTALIATFDVPDKVGDVIRRGAFAATITEWQRKGAMVPVIYSHDWSNPDRTIGEVDPSALRETTVGFEASGRFYLDEPPAAKVFKQLQRKTLTEWSFAFEIERSAPLPHGREIHALTLRELGPCLRGVGQSATLAVKSAAAIPATAAHRQALVRAQLAPLRAQIDLRKRQITLARLS